MLDGYATAPGKQIPIPRTLLLLAVMLSVLFLLPEAAVRWLDPPLGSFRAIRFGNDPQSENLFVRDPRLHWKLRPNVDLQFIGVRVETDRDGFRGELLSKRGRIVLSLGDSTTFGWGVEQKETYSSRLDHALASRDPASQWRVVNAGVPGYSSYQLRLLAARLVPKLLPAVAIVCMSNNDPSPQARPDREIDEGRILARKMIAPLSHSRYLVWLAETLRPRPRPRNRAESMVVATPRVPITEVGSNLRSIIEVSRRAGAKVIVIGPPTNLFSMPLRAGEFAGWREIKRRADEGNARLRAGDRRGAEARFRSLLADYPEDFRALWLNGLFDAKYAGRLSSGLELLEEAFEHHPFPARARRSHRRAAHLEARAAGVAFFDANAVLAKAVLTHRGVKAWEALYLDHCHPSPAGHEIITEAILARWPPRDGGPGASDRARARRLRVE